MAPKIPYYVVVKGKGYFRPNASMRALGFERVRCGKDGPSAWAIADVWARLWEQAKRGEFVSQCQQIASLKTYPSGSIGEAFQRFRRTAEWAKKAPRTREEWERGWTHLEPLLADVAPGTISLEDMSEVRTAIEARVSWREAHRVIKIWRALWKVAAAMGYCNRECDPSLGIHNSAPPPRQALWREGEVVRLVKAAWRAGYRGLAAVMATGWDTQLSPVDIRRLSVAHIARNSQGMAFMVLRAKTGRAAAGTLSRRAEAVLDAYMAGLSVELLETAPIFRNRSGLPYSKDTLGDDFRDVRAAVFGVAERRTLADFRRSGAIEAAAVGADAATISAKMANTLSASNALHRAYRPVEITRVRAADVARLAGRRKMREKEK
jgi:hypothetical protein